MLVHDENHNHIPHCLTMIITLYYIDTSLIPPDIDI